MTCLIETKKLRKVFINGEVSLVAVNDIDLKINRGEFIALVGSSGSGKTTLMHLLGCLDNPTSGQIIVEGKDISTLSIKQLAHMRNRKIGFVFQNFYLLNDLTSTENIVLPQLYGGIREREAKNRAKELLQMVGLENRQSHYPYQLSGGQRQRVAIARALAMDPPILLADEPTGNLDSENSTIIMDIFSKINELKQTTIIIVTHEREIARNALRCITIHDGKIAFDVCANTK